GASMEDSAARGLHGNQRDNAAQDAGAAYVFMRNGTNWRQDSYLKASNAEAFDEFGVSVAISADGRTLVIGAPTEAGASGGVNVNQNDNSAPEAGAAYVFARN
ncbi:MAG TPA: FG-GAP repeat protein, partial [Burkholderiales bacterium]|nr:FG-GAP repeat protein [Burkholderiales bacterium]